MDLHVGFDQPLAWDRLAISNDHGEVAGFRQVRGRHAASSLMALTGSTVKTRCSVATTSPC